MSITIRHGWYDALKESLLCCMASRVFSSPRSLHMLLPILLVSIAILVAAVTKQSQELSRLSASETTAVAPAGWSAYANPSLKLNIAVPSDADIVATLETFSSITERLGRVGGMSVNSNANDKPHMSVLVYTTEEKLGRDFGAIETQTLVEEMKGLGLSAKTVTIDGVSANVFYGVHPVDGVGGSEYDYVAAEIVGPTYAYMVQFYSMGTDPDAEAVMQYLRGFDAK